MRTRPQRWIWQHDDWPHLSFDHARVAGELSSAHRMHGFIEGKAAAIGLTTESQVALDVIAAEVQATAAIEGEKLSIDVVRSSVLRRLGLGDSGPVDRSVDGLVAVVQDATERCDEPLDDDRLYRWQSALFPGGTSGINRIAVARYRDHEDPMQIVSGRPGKEIVHYQAPPSREVRLQMERFLGWFAATAPTRSAAAGDPPMDGLARAAIAHLWFESVHPFEDGNGRIGRAIVDMAIAQHRHEPVRLISLSQQLLSSRTEYYDALNSAQRGGLDVTEWVRWFVAQCAAAYAAAGTVIDQALEKRRFWEQPEAAAINARQHKVLQRLLDDGDGGFLGGLNAEKYMKITGAPKSTATRDLSDLVSKGLLWTSGAGKALRYYIAVPGWSHGGVPPSQPTDA